VGLEETCVCSAELFSWEYGGGYSLDVSGLHFGGVPSASEVAGWLCESYGRLYRFLRPRPEASILNFVLDLTCREPVPLARDMPYAPAIEYDPGARFDLYGIPGEGLALEISRGGLRKFEFVGGDYFDLVSVTYYPAATASRPASARGARTWTSRRSRSTSWPSGAPAGSAPGARASGSSATTRSYTA
jgi:hypothetical protein